MAQLVAAQYARGLFELALETNQFDIITDCLVSLKAVAVHDEFKVVINHPEVLTDEKFGILKCCAPEGAPDEFFGFLRLLVERGRAVILPEIIDEYVKLVDERANVVHVRVVSAGKLPGETLSQIRLMLGRKLAKKIRFEEEIDPSVIAGFKVYAGDDLIDISVKTDIEEIRNSLIGHAGAK